MAMSSINNNGAAASISNSQKTPQINDKTQSNVAPTSAPSAATDTVTLTSAASQLRSLEQQLTSLPIVDIQRVDAIKRDIANGTYDIQPTRLAEKMIQMEMVINTGLG